MATSASRLGTAALRRARAYVDAHGRPLDRAFAAWRFDGAAKDAVIAALARFQNPDGGFHGLEPDLRTPASSPMATSVAFQYLGAIGADPAAPVVTAALRYLETALDRKRLAWRTVGPEVNDAPHAPWWTFDPATGATRAGSAANPTAELAAAFLRFSPRPPAWLAGMVDAQVEAILAAPDAIEMHDLMCYLHLFDEIDPARADRVASKLVTAGRTITARTPEQWANYGTKPLWLAPARSAHLAKALRDELAANLDWEIAQQAKDGSWAPAWTWFGDYPESWPLAEREWRGILTVRTLMQLADHDRL
jgi:hypothetical protein